MRLGSLRSKKAAFCVCVSKPAKCAAPLHQARKKSTKINFLGPESARWGGGLPCEGVVAKEFVLSLESLSSLGFEERNLGCPGNFAGMSRTLGGVQKVSEKKVRAHSLKTVTSLNKEARPLKLHFSLAILVFGDNELKCFKCFDRKAKIAFRTSRCCNR